MTDAIGIDLPLVAIREYCERQPIKRLSLFGSFLRGDACPDSDVDLLVEYVPGAPVGLLTMVGQEIKLSEILGKRVDLRTAQDLSRYFRQEVVDNAMLIYQKK
ncbi:MAG: nucleotidyltransferase domain-containing protein [Chloroflexi bacterium]|nr:nucleotidyltransferase domain-containing protein [Chloroflexota bacterium]